MNMYKKWFITGIGTGIGKTTVAAILTEALRADYWKPIQSGDLQNSDSKTIQVLTTNTTQIHQEQYRLELAASPHKSAALENTEIELSKFLLPKTKNHLLVEGAGGLFVPLNEKDFIIDLIQHLDLKVVLVANNYLGCINHTILSIEALRQREISIDLFVFNGNFDEDTHRIIYNYLPKELKKIYIPELTKLSKNTIKEIAKKIYKSI